MRGFPDTMTPAKQENFGYPLEAFLGDRSRITCLVKAGNGVLVPEGIDFKLDRWKARKCAHPAYQSRLEDGAP